MKKITKSFTYLFVAASLFLTTTIHAQINSCGGTINNLAQKLYAAKVQGATNYRYKIENTPQNFSFVLTKGSADTTFALVNVPGIAYGHTYSIKMSAFVNGTWSPYSTFSCFVTTPAMEPKLAIGSCGTMLTNLAQKLSTKKMTGATNYRYKINSLDSLNMFSTVFTKGSADTTLALSAINGIQYGKAYLISVSYYSNGVWSPYGNPCYVMTPAVAPKLSGNYYTMLSNMGQKLYSKKIAAATNYRYKIESMDSLNMFSTVFTKGNADSSLVLGVINGLMYDKIYSIKVSYYSNGVWSPFGEPSWVKTPMVEPKLHGNYYIMLSNLSQKLYCRKIDGATNYRYKIENYQDSLYTLYIKGYADTSLLLTMIPGIKYNRNYTIKVSYYSNGVWSPYGMPTYVMTPHVEPRLVDNSCQATISNLWQQKLSCRRIDGATNYRYKIQHEGGTFSTLFTKGTADTTLMLGSAAGVTLGKIYSIQVSYFSNDVWSPLGSPCYVTTVTQKEFAIEEETSTDISVYPNPVMDNMTIIGSEQFIYFEVMNVLGQTVIQQSNTDKQNNLTLNVSELPEGTYFVKMRDEQNNIIVRKIAKK